MGIIFRYLNSVAVIFLVSVHFLGATEENELYRELRDALLTEDNIFKFQQAFYSSDSKVEFYLNVTVNIIKENKKPPCSAFYFDKSKSYYPRNDSVQISSYSKNLEAYLRPYISTHVKFYDLTFFKLLTSVGYKENPYYYDGTNSNHQLDINMKNLTTNPTVSTYINTLQMLFQWVSNVELCVQYYNYLYSVKTISFICLQIN